MIKKEVRKIINKVLNTEGVDSLQFTVEESKYGDFSSNFALRLGKLDSYQTPLEIANYFQPKLEKEKLFSEVTITEPGFVNLNIDRIKAAESLPNLNTVGFSETKNKNKKVRVEFISANPTGPLHIGNARGGPLGDVIANVLQETGYEVTKEYYDNNIGTQVDIFGDSLTDLIKESFGEKVAKKQSSYQGGYIQELALALKEKLGIKTLEDTQTGSIKEEAVKLMFAQILNDAKAMGISFDEIFHEDSFQREGKTTQVIEVLKDKGLTKEEDGSVWFAPNDEFLKDKEAVLVRSDSRPTYFADDIAYHKEKFDSKPDLVINVLGSNHHSHIDRLKAAINALGFDVKTFKPIMYQYVRVVKGKEVFKMAKREGNFITAKEVLEEVGKDAFRFFLLSTAPQTHMDFDIELAKKQSNENPVYYVQYAYARISSILAKALEVSSKVDYSRLTSDEEFKLIKTIDKLSDLISDLSQNFQVHQLTFYAIELADHFHSFYEKQRVISEDETLTATRLELVKATQLALKKTLDLLGIAAPERM